MNTRIHLRPLISLNRKQKGTSQPTQLHNDASHNCNHPLIAVVAMNKEQLPLIAHFQIEHEKEQQCTLVYLSTNTIRVGSIEYRVVYIPASKTDHQIFSCFADVFRQLADIVISDINSVGVHKLKEKQHINNKHFVLSGERDIYQVAIKESSLQLLKSIQVPFLSNLQQWSLSQHVVKVTDVGDLMSIVGRYSKSWQWILSQKSWNVLSSFLIEHYKCANHLKTYNVLQSQTKMLSIRQIQDIRLDLLSLKSNASTAILQNVVESMISQIEQSNQQHVFTLIAEIRNQIAYRSIGTFIQLQDVRKQLSTQLCGYSIPLPIIEDILLPKQLQMHQQIINQKDQLITQLQSNIDILHQTINCKNKALNQYQKKIETQQQKLNSYYELESAKCELQEMLQNETLRNQQLTLQLRSSHLLERKSLESKVELQNKIMHLKHEKEGLLEYLHLLTQQNLSLLNQKQELQNSIKELKDSLQQSSQIEIRALRSIQNQAQIKTRLYRYQKYVSQLKLSIQSFKKLQSEKFNYILAKNYQEFQQLQQKYNQTVNALRKEEKHSKMLNQSLQRERIRLNYFQKLLTSNYQHESIPECSEQNSETDREIPAIAVD